MNKVQSSLLSTLIYNSGNPHSTPSRNDPYHGTVELYNNTGQRITSAHVYPNAYVKFSKEDQYPAYRGLAHPKAPIVPVDDPAASKSKHESSKK